MSTDYRLINPAVLMDAAGDDLESFDELLATFVRIAPPMARELQQAVHDKRHDDIAHHAHCLKSCLALVGAASTGAQLEQLERAARRGDCDCGAGFDQLQQELTAVLAEALDCHAARGA